MNKPTKDGQQHLLSNNPLALPGLEAFNLHKYKELEVWTAMFTLFISAPFFEPNPLFFHHADFLHTPKANTAQGF